jgi:hypothetical protein
LFVTLIVDLFDLLAQIVDEIPLFCETALNPAHITMHLIDPHLPWFQLHRVTSLLKTLFETFVNVDVSHLVDQFPFVLSACCTFAQELVKQNSRLPPKWRPVFGLIDLLLSEVVIHPLDFFLVHEVDVVFDALVLGENRDAVHKLAPASALQFFVFQHEGKIIVEAEVGHLIADFVYVESLFAQVRVAVLRD